MRIALAADHRGFTLKEHIRKYLTGLGHEVSDFGPVSSDPFDYPDSGIPAAEAVAGGECERAILICGTGIGMSIVGNKVRGIRAARCCTVEDVVLAREHNDANVLTLAGNWMFPELAEKMIDAFLSTGFQAGRHERRLGKIADYEKGKR